MLFYGRPVELSGGGNLSIGELLGLLDKEEDKTDEFSFKKFDQPEG